MGYGRPDELMGACRETILGESDPARSSSGPSHFGAILVLGGCGGDDALGIRRCNRTCLVSARDEPIAVAWTAVTGSS